MAEIILASASPRRRELMANVSLDFTVKVADIEETIPEGAEPNEVVMSLALQKAQAVAVDYPENVVVGADTVVVLDGEILGKPKSPENAVQLLEKLSGRCHVVYTGVALVCGDKIKKFCEATEVEFYQLDKKEIDDYVATKDCMDKAGAYGIQGRGCVLVKKINGDYFNVVGLPIAKVCRELRDFNV